MNTSDPTPSLPSGPHAPVEVLRVRHDGAHPLAGAPAATAVAPHQSFTVGLPPALSAAPSALALLRSFSIGLAAAVTTAAAVWFFLPPLKNSASAKLFMPFNPEGVVYRHPDRVNEFQNFQQTQMALVRSRLVLQSALRGTSASKNADVDGLSPAPAQRRSAPVNLTKLSIWKKIAPLDPIEWLQKETKVTFPDSREIMRISIAGEDIEELKLLVAAIRDAYLREIVEKNSGQRIKRLEELVKIRSDYEKKVDQQRVNIRRLAETTNSVDTKQFEMATVLIKDQLAMAEKDLVAQRAKLHRLILEHKVFSEDKTKTAEIPSEVIEGHTEKDPFVQRSKARVNLLNQYIADNARLARDGKDSPAVQKLIKERDEIEAAIGKRKKELRPEVETTLKSTYESDAGTALARLQRQIDFEMKWEKSLEEQATTLAKDLKKTVVGSIDIKKYEFDIALMEDVVRTVASEITRLEVEKEAPLLVQRMAGEEVEGHPVDGTARQAKMAGIGGGGAFAFVVVLVALLEFRARRIHAPEEISHGLGLPVVATLPVYTNRQASSRAAAAWKRLLAESVDSARTMLLHKARTSSMRVVLVTSAVGGEGKTSLSSHLALSLARSGCKTLLIDADLRNPSLAALFNVPGEAGLCGLLRGETEVADVIHPTQAAGLSVLPAGQWCSVSLQMLSRGNIGPVLAALRSQFDFIIIDSSPVLPIADTLQLAPHVDGVLFSVLRTVSRLPKVYAAQQRVAALGVPLLGAVVSGTREELYGYGPRLLTAAVK
jgi:capsular exopolysaccharide synthesis family protein